MNKLKMTGASKSNQPSGVVLPADDRVLLDALLTL
jgi:hypothetical protein